MLRSGICLSCITSFVGGEIIGWGYGSKPTQYVIFRVYGYFCNLIISMVIINTFLSNSISMIVKSLNHLSCGCVRSEKFQFLEKGQNRNFDYKIIISVKNP